MRRASSRDRRWRQAQAIRAVVSGAVTRRLPGCHPTASARARRDGLGAQRRGRDGRRARRGPLAAIEDLLHPGRGSAGAAVGRRSGREHAPSRGPRAVRGARRERGAFVVQERAGHRPPLRPAPGGRRRMRSMGSARGPSLDRPQSAWPCRSRTTGLSACLRGRNRGRWRRRLGPRPLRAGREGGLARGAATRPWRVRSARREAPRRHRPAADASRTEAQWLVIKRRDEQARPGSDVVAEQRSRC